MNMSTSSLMLIAAGIILFILIIFMLKWGVFNNSNQSKERKNTQERKSNTSKNSKSTKSKKPPRNLRDRDFESSDTSNNNRIAKTAVPFPNLDIDISDNMPQDREHMKTGPFNDNKCYIGGTYGQGGSYHSGYNNIEFKHAKVNDSYSKLVIPKPVTNLNAPDIDDLDKIFTHMLDAGAIKGKVHLVTNFEHQYLEKLRLWFGASYHIYCQVSVGSAVNINIDVDYELSNKDKLTFANKCHNMSFDFVLVDRATDRLVCAIELDDPTHQQYDRKARDRRLDKVCLAANIPLFHITELNQKPDLSRMA